MRALLTLLFLTALTVGSFWSWNHIPGFRSKIEGFLMAPTFQTLEVRYTAEAIMEAHRKELLKDKHHVFLAPKLKFIPYLMMDVKYLRSKDKTGEGSGIIIRVRMGE